MSAISDSSPLILYARSGHLDLLPRVFDEIIVPDAVWTETVVNGGGRSEVADIVSATWIRRRSPIQPVIIQSLRAELGPGESEAIGLALETNGRLPILLDDRKARRVARERGLTVLGSVGILLLAKQHRIIPLVKPVLIDLRRCGLYLSNTVVLASLAAAGESPEDTIQ